MGPARRFYGCPICFYETSGNLLDPGARWFRSDIFDTWYGPAVLHERPTNRVKLISLSNETLLRIASGDLDIPHQNCTVNYHIWHWSGDHLILETSETHHMHFFFPLEIELLLGDSGFKLIKLGAFPVFEKEPDETDWTVGILAQAI